MREFEKYLKGLANHEENKSEDYLSDPRNKILVNAGIHLNWLGDFFANSNIKWEKRVISIDDILFAGTNPDLNKILIDRCERSPRKLLDLANRVKNVEEFLKEVLYYREEPILLRRQDDKYIVLDGMHRFTSMVLDGEESVEVYVPVNEFEELPYCESHVIYDLIRGYLRNARDKEGWEALKYALKLLLRTYGNVETLLRERFNENYVFQTDVREVIEEILEEMNG